MTHEQQEMLRAAIEALDEENTTVPIDPNDVIALLRRVEELERTVAFADRKREQDVARIEALMREADEAEKAWRGGTRCADADTARQRIQELERKIEEMSS